VLANTLLVSDIPEIAYRRHQFWSKFPQNRSKLFVFERVGDNAIAGGPHAYVHSKFVLVDDRAVSIASVNMNRRSWYHDSELATVITDAPELIKDLRTRVWSDHLTPGRGEDIRDPAAALALWRDAYSGARQRLRPLKFEKQPARKSDDLVGSGSLVSTITSVLGGPVIDFAARRVMHRAIDEVMNTAYDKLIDPRGPEPC
jgi:phosphatidylserine/phosphatidylglycerophosphate/cardiolipin synthase-like enzyme